MMLTTKFHKFSLLARDVHLAKKLWARRTLSSLCVHREKKSCLLVQSVPHQISIHHVQPRHNCATSPLPQNSESDVYKTESSFSPNPASLNCAGCGITLQTDTASHPGFIPKAKLDDWHTRTQEETEIEVEQNAESEHDKEISPPTEPLICQRCFSLKHYNTALNITLKEDDYLAHLSALKEKRALILLMVDCTDLPASIFPNLNSLVSPSSRVLIIANKVDLLPRGTKKPFWKELESSILAETTKSSLFGCDIMGVHFISAKTGLGLDELSNDITNSWGNRGDVYLLGCTNVGKSTLFNKLLTLLCGARPGQLDTGCKMNVPMATISQWPGTTLGLLSFPLLSVGKMKRLRHQRKLLEKASHQQVHYEDDEFERMAFDDEDILNPKEAKRMERRAKVSTDLEDVLEEIGIGKRRKIDESETLPLNRFWLHDTPGAINNAQLINLLTTKELKLALPKKPLKPKTFILKPEECLFLGGLARLDYLEGSDSAYFTVFAASYLPVHVTKVSKADRVYENNLGSSLLKIPACDPDNRLDSFPPLLSQEVNLCGEDWKRSTADIVLSSAGWVSFTIGRGMEVTLRAHTPLGKGIFVRRPPLFPLAVNERGKRSQSGNRAAFKGK